VFWESGLPGSARVSGPSDFAVSFEYGAEITGKRRGELRNSHQDATWKKENESV
jgi:hypothetical protein